MPLRAPLRVPAGVRRALLAACLLAAPAAWGQLPLPITPGAVLDTLPDRRPALPPTPPEVVFPAPRPGAKHDPRSPRFLVNALAFAGNTVFSERLLKRLTERFVDLQLNLYDLDRAADAVTRYYREHGYPIARAIVPAQKVEKGVVLIEVIEGRIAAINIIGNKRYGDDAILARLANLPRRELVTVEALEEGLLLLNDLPGLSARGTLQPGAEFGTTDLLVRAEEKRHAGSLGLDNRGREEVGRYRLDAGFDLNNPLGLGDQLGLRLIESQQDLLTYARVSYGVPLTAGGLKLTSTYSQVDYRMAGDFAALGIDGEVVTAEIALSYPVLRSRRRNIFLGLGWRNTVSSQRALGVATRADHIKLMSASVLGSWVHEDSAATYAYAAVSGNGKSNPTGLAQDAQYAKFEIDVNHLRAASKTWDLYLRANLVVSHDALADTEKMSLGGPDSVRGYLSAELRGDNGYQGTIELRRQFMLANVPGVFNLFYDAGAARAKGFGGTDSIRSAGLGVTVFPRHYLRAKLEYAHATSDRRSQDGRRERAWLTITASY